MEARIERLEAIAVLLCEQSTHGQGPMGWVFQQFVDDWRREHRGRASEGFRWQA